MTAKEIPLTRMAGRISLAPFQPDITKTSQKGINTDKKGSCRPTILLMVMASNPVTAPAVIIGMPMAPQATGAVLAIRQIPAA